MMWQMMYKFTIKINGFNAAACNKNEFTMVSINNTRLSGNVNLFQYQYIDNVIK